MDPKLLQQSFQRLKGLEDRIHKIRPRTRTSFSSPTVEQLHERHRDLAAFTIELTETVEDLIRAIAAPRPPAGT